MSFQDTSAPQAFTAGAALCPHATVRGADSALLVSIGVDRRHPGLLKTAARDYTLSLFRFSTPSILRDKSARPMSRSPTS